MFRIPEIPEMARMNIKFEDKENDGIWIINCVL